MKVTQIASGEAVEGSRAAARDPALHPRDRIESVEALEALLAAPTRALEEDMRRLDGDILVLGCSGKVGPTLCRMAKSAAPDKRIVGVARFSDCDVRERLESWGVETVSCDLFDAELLVAQVADGQQAGHQADAENEVGIVLGRVLHIAER